MDSFGFLAIGDVHRYAGDTQRPATLVAARLAFQQQPAFTSRPPEPYPRLDVELAIVVEGVSNCTLDLASVLGVYAPETLGERASEYVGRHAGHLGQLARPLQPIASEVVIPRAHIAGVQRHL